MSSDDTSFTFTPIKDQKEEDIESLFNNIRNRSPKIRALYSYQADVVREYYTKHRKTENVGLELPTGSGKTLVGLLIGEWRRKHLNQRVIYLCPTQQLANQVHNQSKEYGIDTRVFIGSKYYYNSTDENLYRTAKTIAIATYSGLFNINPGLNDPQTIIMDDAHGAETYIGSLWSIEITRRDQFDLFSDIIKLIDPYLPRNFISAIEQARPELLPYRSERVPDGYYYTIIPKIAHEIDQWLSANDDDIKFSWSLLRNKLPNCIMYVSYNTILLRPYIPPTLTHGPFAKAEQRIFMSATLGRGGELERITGIKKIERISAQSFDYTNIGRRLYIFPDLAEDITNDRNWVAKRLSDEARTLVLFPNTHRMNQFVQIINVTAPTPEVLDKTHIQRSMDRFSTASHAALLLTNRYDGIDLADEVCKQIIIDGLPSGTNLQELFLEERLGLEVLLNERISTRIQQASGRCTRSPTDSAAVIMRGRKLMNFCQRTENRALLHPELRAEMSFAFEQKKTDSNLLARFLRALSEKNDDWNAIEKYLSERRRSEPLPDSEITKVLTDIVKWEVDYSYALWNNNLPRAIECGIKVSDKLKGAVLAPYRALWYYIVASASKLYSETDLEYDKVCREYADRAAGASALISWFPKALESLNTKSIEAEKIDITQAIAIENVIEHLSLLGPVGDRFNIKISEVRRLLETTNANEFDRGLVELGKLLGFTSFKPAGSAAPDACWQLGNDILYVFEGKSDETPSSGISVQNGRQTSGHLNWCKTNERTKYTKETHVILVTPRTFIDKAALPHGEQVHYLHTESTISLLERVEAMLRESRTFMNAIGESDLRERILQSMMKNVVTTADLKSNLLSTKVTSLPTK